MVTKASWGDIAFLVRIHSEKSAFFVRTLSPCWSAAASPAIVVGACPPNTLCMQRK
jgi:hypothetical protein